MAVIEKDPAGRAAVTGVAGQAGKTTAVASAGAAASGRRLLPNLTIEPPHHPAADPPENDGAGRLRLLRPLAREIGRRGFSLEGRTHRAAPERPCPIGRGFRYPLIGSLEKMPSSWLDRVDVSARRLPQGGSLRSRRQRSRLGPGPEGGASSGS